MAVEKDVGRDVRKMGMLAGVAIIAVTLIFLLLSWLNRPAPTASHISLDKAASGTGQVAQESPEFHALLDKYNSENAQRAAQHGDSYIASVHTDVQPVTSVGPVTTPHAPQPAPAVSRPVALVQTGVSQDQKKAIDSLLKQLAVQWTPSQGGLAGVPGAQTAGERTAATAQPAMVQTSAFAGWTSSLAPQDTARTRVNAIVPGSVQDTVLVPAGSRLAAVVDNKVDSDDRRSHVTAHVPAGAFAGATFLSQDVQLAGDGVSIHFTEMSWHHTCYKVDVWAEQQDTLAGNVATDVNHRYFSRIILPAIAHGIGQVGELYEDANTQILSTQYGSVTANVGAPDGSAVAGTIAGGVADKAGQIMEQDAAKLPVEQVIVARNEPVTLLFMSPMRESDNTQKAQTPTATATVQREAPVPAPAAVPASMTSDSPSQQNGSLRGFPRRADDNY
jgi:intracellular multiplication protein IcmE